MKSLIYFVSLTLLTTLLTACNNAQEIARPPVSALATPTTITPALLPTATPPPGSTPVYAQAQLSSLPEQISFTYQGLATDVIGEIQLARPYVSGPTGPDPDTAYPPHLRFYFYNDLATTPPTRVIWRPHLRIYPVNDYRLIYGRDALGQVNTPGFIINQTIDRLQTLLVDRPQTIEGDLFLPPVHNAQIFKAQLKYLDFQNGAGVRFITQQAIGGPINNQDIFYTFQGLTANGQYYLTLTYPISTAALAEVDADQSFETLEEFQTHVQETTQRLDALSSGDFTPDLSLLDELIQSLQITSTP